MKGNERASNGGASIVVQSCMPWVLPPSVPSEMNEWPIGGKLPPHPSMMGHLDNQIQEIERMEDAR